MPLRPHKIGVSCRSQSHGPRSLSSTIDPRGAVDRYTWLAFVLILSVSFAASPLELWLRGALVTAQIVVAVAQGDAGVGAFLLNGCRLWILSSLASLSLLLGDAFRSAHAAYRNVPSLILRRRIGVSRPSRFDSRTVVVKCISVYALKLIFFGCGQRYN